MSTMDRWSPYPDEISEIDVDGRIDEKGVRFLGTAKRQPDGTWRALADVGGVLCVVEATVTWGRKAA